MAAARASSAAGAVRRAAHPRPLPGWAAPGESYNGPRPPRPVPGAEEGRDGDGDGGEDGGDEGREILRHVARLESDPVAFRSMTSLDMCEARNLYRQAESLAAARAAQGEGAGRRGGSGDGGDDAAFEFMPFGKFLMALMQARKTDERLVGYVFRVDPGTALAAFEDALPLLLEIRDMPRRFARRLVPFGYKLDAKPNKGKGSGSMLDYME